MATRHKPRLNRLSAPLTLLTVVGLLVTAPGAATATPVDVRWTAAADLSSAGQDATDPHVVSSADGRRIVSAWTGDDGTVHLIQARSSGDGGATWSPVLNLSDTAHQATDAQVVASTDGTRITTVWRRNDGTHEIVQTRVSSDAGATWSAVTDLSAPGENAYTPRIAGSADGTRVVVVWQRDDGTNYRIQTRSSADAGGTWSPVTDLSAPGENAGTPHVAASADGTRLAAVWRRNDGTRDIIQTRSSTDAGATWSPVTDLSAPGENAYQPRVSASADGSRLAAAWRRNDGTRDIIQTRSSTDAGAIWSPVTDLSAPGENSREPQVVSSASGTRMHAVWTRGDGVQSVVQIRSSADGGVTFGPAVTLSDVGQEAQSPQLAASSDGVRVSLVWRRKDGTHFIVQSKSSSDGGATWSPVADLSAAGQNAHVPQVAPSVSGTRITVVWQRTDGTNDRVQVATGALSTVPGQPTAVVAAPKPRKAKVSWTPPADDGNSPITQYTATAQPGGQGCVTTGTACTITGLTNRTTYTVTVTATNAVGTGPDSPPVQVTPAPKAVAIAKPVAGRSKLKVRITPNLGPRKQWKFTVKKRVEGVWTTLTRKTGTVKVYKTRGPKHIRVLNLPKGRYKARSRAARGYLPDNSTIVRLRK